MFSLKFILHYNIAFNQVPVTCKRMAYFEQAEVKLNTKQKDVINTLYELIYIKHKK